MKRLTIAVVCAAFLVFAAGTSAHENYRIIGTVAKLAKDTVDVKQTKDGKVITMDWTEKSKVTRDKQAVPRAEIKVGANVVVDAHGDSLDELDVVELRLEAVELSESVGRQLELVAPAGEEMDTRLSDGLRQVRASTGSGSVCAVVEVAPWSRIPEARALFVPRDE